MAIFNRKSKNNQSQPPKKTFDAGYLNEGMASSNGVDLNTFVQGLHRLDSNYINNDLLLERMCEDSIISSAVSMWIEDTLQRDPYTSEIFHVEVDKPKDDTESTLSEGLTEELESFLKKDLQMEKYLPSILARIIKYGQCPMKLDFADLLDDAKLELKESNKVDFAQVSVKLDDMFGDITKDKSIDSMDRRLNESTSSSYLVDTEYLGESHYVIPEAAKTTSGILKESEYINLKANSKKLSEDDLRSIKRMIKGRWYTEFLGHGTNIYELSSKQKLVAYLDRDAINKFIKPNRIINFMNNTGKHRIQFEIGGQQEQPQSKKYYQLERGESFLENSMVAWQVLSALEDILLLTRMTRSLLYRIFSVEVGNKGNKEVFQLLQNLKNKIKMDETVDVRSKIYNSSLSQVPLGDSIFIPTRNGVGVVDIKTVGGDINMTDAVDLDYFKNKLFAGLRIPKAYFGFGEDSAGMMNQSLTQMDVRYCRTIVRLQSILSLGLKDLCNLYLDLTRTSKARPEIPDFKIVFTSPTSSEDDARSDMKVKQMDTLAKVLEQLGNLGITLNSDLYTNTREMLIKEYFGSRMLDSIKEDERIQPATAPSENDEKSSISSSPSLSGPSDDIISGPDVEDNNPDLSDDSDESNTSSTSEEPESNEEPGETETSNVPPSDEDFEIG